MRIEFRTNIDCCKRFVSMFSSIARSEINPQIGDNVRIFARPTFEVWLKVVDRYWHMTTIKDEIAPVLIVELHLQDGWTILRLEEVLRGH